MKTMVTLTHEEAQSYLAYALICETVNNPALTSPLVIDGACRATRKPG